MVFTLKIPLEQLIGKLLKGEVTALSEKRLYLYVENLTNGDKGKLRQALKDIDDMVAKWKDGYFISVYEERVIAFNRSKLACLLYTSPSPRDTERARMPSSA